MGNSFGSSSPSEVSSHGRSSYGSSSRKRVNAAALPSTGRYIKLLTPGGIPVHVLGVYPCATVSEEETAALISSVRPSVVYVDTHPELLDILIQDVKAGRYGEQWKIPEQSPPFHKYDNMGWLVSLNIRNLLADNEMLGLVGNEAYNSFKTAIQCTLGILNNGNQQMTSSSSSSPSSSNVPTLISFPLPMQYNNGETLDRPNQLNYMIVGNASTGSSAISALLGNPNVWFYGGDQDDPVPGITTIATTNTNSTKVIAGNSARPDIDFPVGIPDTGYFTRTAVLTTQNQFREAVNKVASVATITACDVESDLLVRETRSRNRGETTAAEVYAGRALLSQKQSAAIAFHMQTQIDELLTGYATDASNGSGSTPNNGNRTSTVSKGSTVNNNLEPCAVAIMNIGSVASLQRNWNEAHPPQDVFPPLSPIQNALGYAAPAVLGSGTLWILYKGFKRYPKTTGVITLTITGSIGAVVYSAIHGDWTRYGSWVRAALARPRVTSPLVRANK